MPDRPGLIAAVWIGGVVAFLVAVTLLAPSLPPSRQQLAAQGVSLDERVAALEMRVSVLEGTPVSFALDNANRHL